MKEIEKQIPAGRRLKILDVGCGAGFFSILLAKEGHEVFGIDLTPEMIENAIQLAEEENADDEAYPRRDDPAAAIHDLAKGKSGSNVYRKEKLNAVHKLLWLRKRTLKIKYWGRSSQDVFAP